MRTMGSASVASVPVASVDLPNGTCGPLACDPVCQVCDVERHVCVSVSCSLAQAGQCGCPRLSQETLVAVGAVVLCLVLLLLAMALWHWRRCGDWRSSFTLNTTEYNPSESLLGPGASGGASQLRFSRPTRGRTSIDSTLSCLVCMDRAIDCVLMPCAHEVACSRCAAHLQLCPVCRTAVDTTMKVHVASQEQLLEAALGRARDHPFEDSEGVDASVSAPASSAPAPPPNGASKS